MLTCNKYSSVALTALLGSAVIFYLSAFFEWKSPKSASFDVATANMESNHGYRAVAYFVNWLVACPSDTTTV